MDITFGLVAIAGISERFVGAVQACGGQVAAAASRNLIKAEEFCRKHQIPNAYGSYQELYQDPEIMVVYIATPNGSHAKEVRSALMAGKHILCEKPLALSETEARELFDLAQERNLFLMEMQKSVFLPVTGLIRSYIKTEKMGRLYQVDMSASFESPAAAWMHEADQGGVVYGSASYTFEYLDYLLEPENTSVQAFGTREDTGAVDAVSMNIKMGEVLINSRISMRAPASSEAVFYFEKGFIRVPYYWKAVGCEVNTGGVVEQVEIPDRYEMRHEVEHVIGCLTAGQIESPVMPGARTVRCCALVDEVMRSV